MGTLDIQLEDGTQLTLDLDGISRLPAGMQAQALKALREIEQRVRWNPMLRYKPASARHAEFHAADEPLKAFFGGNRAGKTTTAIVDDIIQACPIELLPPRLAVYKQWECPFYCRVMTPDMERTMKPVIYEKLREWLPKDLLRGGSFDKSFDKQASSLRLECGCRFDFLSYEMAVDKFGGAALHRCHYDEEPPVAIRRECLLRLADYNGQELLSMTPLQGITWAYRRVWKRRAEPSVYAIKVSIHENPHIDQAAKARVLGEVADEKERAAREHGDFMHEGGLVYPIWRSTLVEPQSDAEIRTAENVVSIDPGIRYAGFTFTAFDELNNSHTWAARKIENAVGEDYRELIDEVLADVGLTIENVDVVIDPNAVARGLAKGESILDELGRYDVFPILGNNDVEAGVKQIRRRMRNASCTIADPDRGGDTQDLVDELEELALDIDANRDDGEFKIVKTNDHVADAWRYGHMHRPWLPELVGQIEDLKGVPWWERATPPPRRRLQDAGSVMGAEA